VLALAERTRGEAPSTAWTRVAAHFRFPQEAAGRRTGENFRVVPQAEMAGPRGAGTT
jgi:hypothetical protein